MGPGARGCPPERWPADVPASAHLFVDLDIALAHLQERFGATLAYLDESLTETKG